METPLVRSRMIARRIMLPGALVLALGLTPTIGGAQECTDCVVYATTELNLRQEPALEAPVLRLVPEGSPLQQTAGDETNGYVPVSYDSVEGWVIAPGVVSSPEEVGVGAATAAAPSAPTTASADARVALVPLLLRSGPAIDAEPILTMPEGTVVTLTREGAENGYVTVDVDGVIGWAYADFLGELSDTA
jgi:uncharacterized protein YraI